ncbi:DUF2905 domain-containing protein [bacterium]|nr:DUF2905 domain-containing protein [bacterium]
MNGFSFIAKTLIIMGGFLLFLGGLLLLLSTTGWRWKLLPGDIYIQRDNFTFYFPITTCILASLFLTLLLTLISLLLRR